MKINKLPPLKFLKECFELDYSLESGLRWRERPECHFKNYKGYNFFKKRYSHKMAGTKDNLGYFKIFINKKKVIRLLAHRVVYVLFKNVDNLGMKQIDHIDGNPGNNKPDNLREVCTLENMRNRKIHKNNTTGCPGLVKKGKKFALYIYLNYKRYYLGIFSDIDEATRKYEEVKNKISSYYYQGLSQEDLVGKIKSIDNLIV